MIDCKIKNTCNTNEDDGLLEILLQLLIPTSKG